MWVLSAPEKARGQEPPNLQELVNDLEPTALGTYASPRRSFLAFFPYARADIATLRADMIPTDARTQVEAMVRAFVEKSIE